MYTLFYNLERKPFTLDPDPSFLWLGEKHQQIFSSFFRGIADGKGFLLLTGAAGSGKTTLVTALTELLDKDTLCAVIADPRLERIDFYNAIGRGFGLKKTFSSKVQFLIHFSHFLHKADGEGKNVLLVVDNCHNLRQEMLEELRLLASLEKEDTKLMDILLTGRPEFNDILEKPKNRALRERLIWKAELSGLNVDETAQYIRHRLKIAGTEEDLFTPAAVQAVHRFSYGVPRGINILCDRALAAASEQARRKINDKMIESSIRDVDLSGAYRAQEGSVQSFCRKKISAVGRTISWLWSFIGEKVRGDRRFGYGLGLLAFLFFGVALWFAVIPSLKTIQGAYAVSVGLEEVEDLERKNIQPVVPVLQDREVESKEEESVPLPTTIRIRPLEIRETRDDLVPGR